MLFFFQDEGSSICWQLAFKRTEVMLCKRVQLSSQRSWPETDGVILHRGSRTDPIFPCPSVHRHMVLHSDRQNFLYITYIVLWRWFFQNCRTVSSKCRDSRVEELWGLNSFFGYSTQTFVHAVNLLDRFLTVMKVSLLENIQCWVLVSVTCNYSHY